MIRKLRFQVFLFLTVAIMLLIPFKYSEFVLCSELLKYKVINNKYLCFTFQVPEKWKMLTSKKNKTYLEFQDPVKTGFERLVVNAYLACPKTNETIIEKAVASLSKPSKYRGCSNIKNINEGIARIDTIKAYQITWQYKKNGKYWRKTVIVFDSGSGEGKNDYVGFFLVSPRDSLKEHNEILKHIKETLRFRK